MEKRWEVLLTAVLPDWKSIDYSLDQPPYSSMVNNVPYFVAGDVSTFIAKIESMCS